MFVGEPARVRPFTRRLNLDKAHQRVGNRNGIVWPRREVRKSAFTDKADGVRRWPRGKMKMKIISFESSEERIGFLLLVVFMACVIGFAVWHVYAYPPCTGLYGKELTDCEDYQVYLSEHMNDD
jgi:hypothetical protein